MELRHPPVPRSFDDMVEAAGRFVQCYRRLHALPQEARSELLDLIGALDETLDDSDLDSTYAAIAQSLFPECWSEETDWREFTADADVADEFDAQETFFARSVERLMIERGLTQRQLAEAVGVGQPAVSLLLSRRARPQRRTVQKFAAALGVDENELWPEATVADKIAPLVGPSSSDGTIQDSEPPRSLVESVSTPNA